MAINYFGNLTNVGLDLLLVANEEGEIDLRAELADLLRGTAGGLAHGHTFILRRARRNDDGSVKQCPCVNRFTGEADKDTVCLYCAGEKILFDEETFIGYSVQNKVTTGIQTVENSDITTEAGRFNLPAMTLYTEYSLDPTREDIVVEIEHDLEGDPISPPIRLAKYRITDLVGFRSDNGRVEFFKLLCSRIYTSSYEYGEGVTP